MTNELDRHVGVYTGNNLCDFDNQIVLNWYPPRINAHCAGARSVLELGLGHGHGYTTTILSRHFARHVVLESSAVVATFKANHPESMADVPGFNPRETGANSHHQLL